MNRILAIVTGLALGASALAADPAKTEVPAKTEASAPAKTESAPAKTESKDPKKNVKSTKSQSQPKGRRGQVGGVSTQK